MVSNSGLNDLLQAYQLLNVDNHLEASPVKSSIMALARRQVMQGNTLTAQREKEISSLRYGDKVLTMPDQAQLEALTAAELEFQWQHLTGAQPLSLSSPIYRKTL